ncbi:MAG: DUF1109 domain-containing protein [Ancalomicrobiaceae bacterium]|nr:DUF1109 domain-containing protein [Ancalomicrobiaceae bacterium]
MDTDQLIDRLVADHRPVDPRWIERASLMAALAALGVAIVLVATIIGFRSDIPAAVMEGRIVAKYGFVILSSLVAGLVYCRMARPGRQLKFIGLAYLLPLGFIGAAAGLAASGQGLADIGLKIADPNWRFCLIFVPSFAIIPFFLFAAVLKRAAPTDLKGAGFAAGILATSVVSLAYASHCPADSPLFVTVWYPLAYLIGGLAGRTVAPRVLRW